MQAAIATELIISGIALIALPTLLIVIVPLLDKILNEEVIENINNVIDNIDYLIGSTGTNLLFATIGLILVMPFFRWLINFFTGKHGD